MNVADKELCKELHELSGWKDTTYRYGKANGVYTREITYTPTGKRGSIPAYDLGYLLRKLPLNIAAAFFELNHFGTDSGYWVAQYCKHDLRTQVYTYKFSNHADTPEDAACKLCCELIKQGILHKEPNTHE